MTLAPLLLSSTVRPSVFNLNLPACILICVVSAELNSAPAPYFQPSVLASRVVGAVLLDGQPLTPISPCGSNNCSSVTTVSAPVFSCTPGAENTSALTWDSSVLLSSAGPGPTYVGAQFDDATPANEYLGWDFIAHYADAGRFVATEGSNVTCISYNATYHLNY
jgi:hypothetical protein